MAIQNMAMRGKVKGAEWTAVLVLSMLLLGCTGAIRQESARLPTIDQQRFLGTWHIIANIPYFPEKGKVATRVEYVKRSDGRVDDLFYFRSELNGPEHQWSGVAWPLDASGARWKARFIWPFSTEFWVVGIDAGYEVALIATPDAKLAWVYARQPQLDPARYQAALAQLREFGVDTEAMMEIPR